MPVVFKTAKIAERAEADPLLYETLRDLGLSGNELAAQVNDLLARLTAVEGKESLVMRAQEFSSGTTTFTTGANVTEVWVTGCAGGGGAGGVETDTAHGGVGGGGGGESVYRKKLTVTASTGYSVVIGAGGTQGTDSATAGSVTAGGTGGNTTFGALLTLTGGGGSGAVTGMATGRGGAAGGPGATHGQTGISTVAGTGTDAMHGLGGISFPGGWGAGGQRGAASPATGAGRGGYLLVEWNE